MNWMDININLFRMINNLGKELTALNPVMIFIAQYTIYFLVVAVIFIAFSKKGLNRVMVLCGVLTLIISEVLGKIAGLIHSNNQPFHELTEVNKLIEKAVDNSFPSDHIIVFFSFCFTFWLFNRGWSFLWIALASLVGFSRVWVGVHYPADVLAGATISTVVAIIVYYVVPRLLVTRNKIKSAHHGKSI